MTVIIAQNTPDKVRGLLKRWFLEPKPNVFVGTVNRRTREKVLAYILRYSPEDLSLLVISDDCGTQGFSVIHYREPKRRASSLSGLYLVETPPDPSAALPEIPFPQSKGPAPERPLPPPCTGLVFQQILEQSLICYEPKK